MLRKDRILEKTNNGLAVFKHYLKSDLKVGRNFLNPLYEDHHASCNVYFDRHNGAYKMKDFGNENYTGDCFFLVGQLHGLDCSNNNEFIEIMRIINRDMLLDTDDTNPLPTQKVISASTPQTSAKIEGKPYAFKEKIFSNTELEYWQQFGITSETLSHFNISSIHEFESQNSDGKPYCLVSSDKEPIYGYKNKRYIKLYRPFSSVRFLYGGQLDENYCFGLEQLPTKGDTIFITGGEKDVLSMSAKGFHAICFNSETSSIPGNLIYKLTFRFKHIVLLYDMDKTGIESSKKQEKLLAEYDVKRLELPLSGIKEEKDVSDYFNKGYTREDFLKLFLDFLDTIYSNTMTMLKPCEINFNNPPAKAQEIISAGDVPLGTQGNLLCITGGEGTGKSNYIAALVAGAVSSANDTDTLGINVCMNEHQKAVLLYDTEQSEVQLYKNVANLLRRAQQKEMPKGFKAFCLTAMSRKERLQAIIQSMDKFHYEYGGIQMVVIDGVADLIRCANDEAESIAIVDELYRLAGIYRTCIITVLHFVPNGMKLRGHLGSELQRKAAAILSIEKDDNPTISVVKALKVRDGSPLDVPLMQFAWSKEKGMHIYVGEKSREVKEERKKRELENLAKDVFNRQSFIIYIDLCEQIQEMLEVSERTAKSYIKFMRDKEIIMKDPSNPSYYVKGVI